MKHRKDILALISLLNIIQDAKNVHKDPQETPEGGHSRAEKPECMECSERESCVLRVHLMEDPENLGEPKDEGQDEGQDKSEELDNLREQFNEFPGEFAKALRRLCETPGHVSEAMVLAAMWVSRLEVGIDTHRTRLETLELHMRSKERHMQSLLKSTQDLWRENQDLKDQIVSINDRLAMGETGKDNKGPRTADDRNK